MDKFVGRILMIGMTLAIAGAWYMIIKNHDVPPLWQAFELRSLR